MSANTIPNLPRPKPKPGGFSYDGLNLSPVVDFDTSKTKAAQAADDWDEKYIQSLAGKLKGKKNKGKGQIAGIQGPAPSPAKPTSRYLPEGTTDPGDLKPDPLRFTNAVDEGMGYNVASNHGGHYIDEGPHKGKSPGRAYNDIKKRVDSTVTEPTQTARVDANGQISSTGTNKQIEGSNLLDRGTADVRRGRMAQDSDNRYNRAAAAVRARKQEMQNDRERDNLQIEEYGTSTKDGVTRFYNDADRIAAGNSARDSDAAQKMAASGGDMNKARELAKGSVGNDRSNAHSSEGRATVVQTDPNHTPYGSPGYGIAGVPLVDNKEDDSKTGSGVGMGLDEAKQISSATGPGGGRNAGQLDASDRIGASIRSTAMGQHQQSVKPVQQQISGISDTGGISKVSRPESAMSGYGRVGKQDEIPGIVEGMEAPKKVATGVNYDNYDPYPESNIPTPAQPPTTSPAAPSPGPSIENPSGGLSKGAGKPQSIPGLEQSETLPVGESLSTLGGAAINAVKSTAATLERKRQEPLMRTGKAAAGAIRRGLSNAAKMVR